MTAGGTLFSQASSLIHRPKDNSRNCRRHFSMSQKHLHSKTDQKVNYENIDTPQNVLARRALRPFDVKMSKWNELTDALPRLMSEFR